LDGYMKYNKNYRLSIISFAIALAPIIWVATVSAVLFASPTSSTVLGLSTWGATMTLFFIPTIAGAALMLGTNFRFIAMQSKRIGGVKPIENQEETNEETSLQKPQ